MIFRTGRALARTSSASWLLAAILVAALVLRLASIHFGLPALNDPDELMFELGAVRMLRGPTLNPGWFGHPATITMYVLALVNVLVFVTGWLAGWFASVKDFGEAIYLDPSWVILPGRIAMTGFALGTLALTCRLGERLIDRRTGLIAAALLAVSPLHITYSQIIRSDMMACFFMLLTLLAALDIIERNRRADYLKAALWLALSITTKWPFALGIVAVGAAVALLAAQGRITFAQAIGRLAGVGLLTCLLGIALSPYLVLDYQTVIRNLTGEGQVRHLGSTGGTLWQNALWYLRGPLWSGLGPAGLILAPLGTAVLWRNRSARMLLLPLMGSFFLLLCFQSIVWDRWALPLLAPGAILAAAACSALIDKIISARSKVSGVMLTAALLTVLMLPPLMRTQADARERMHDTRQIASAWARRHIPAGSTILIEHFAFDLASQPWHFVFPMGDAGCVDALAMLDGKTSYTPVDKVRGSRSNVDYGTMAPEKRAQCRPDYAILTQYDRYRQERDMFPAEYAAYRELLARGEVVATFSPEPGKIGGRVTTIVKLRSD